MKTYAILVSIIVIGLILSLVSNAISSDHWTHPWILQLAAILVIGGGLGIIDKSLLFNDFLNKTRTLFKIHESATDLGLKEISRNAQDYPFSDFIKESKSLSIVMNDGRTWISSRLYDLSYRFNQKDKITEFFLPNPEGDFIRILAKKTNYTEKEQINKIIETKKRIIEEYVARGKKGILKIYYIPNYPTHSVFFGSTKAIITLYSIPRTRQAVPLFIFNNNNIDDSLYGFVQQDIKILRKESECVYNSGDIS
ncbi:MAG: hypothetical protein GY839_06815 [candidate division Zixibacteria bacterium]|nr:hypothetical protein [candidate division Zixibacteria bacterium]